MATATIIERETDRAEYDLPRTMAIIDHAEHGRLLLAQGFGGMDDLRGGMYRWCHGSIQQLRPDDTFASLRAAEWTPGISLLSAVLDGRDRTRPGLNWTGAMIAACAEATGL